MSVSSVGSSSLYVQRTSAVQSDTVDGGGTSAESDALQALFRAYSDDDSGVSSSVSSSSSAADDGSATTKSTTLSSDVLSALFSLQGGQGQSGTSGLQSIFDKFDSDSDGAIGRSEFESAIGSDADKTKVDGLFSKLDADGDGFVSQSELQPALQKVLGGDDQQEIGRASCRERV